MTAARIVSLEVTNFKSIYDRTRIEFGALTVLLGKNNSGKSTITQALLLLKQTLELARVETPLHLDGYVKAIGLRELISGWPPISEEVVQGPIFAIEWTSTVDVPKALVESENPDVATLAERGGIPWLKTETKNKNLRLTTRMELNYSDRKGKVTLDKIAFSSKSGTDLSGSEPFNAEVETIRNLDGRFDCSWGGHLRKKIEVNVHHFFPGLSVDKRNIGPRHTERSLANAFNILFAQPFDDLEEILKGFFFLSSTRSLPPPLYPPASSETDNIGVSGEFAAQLLYAHQNDPVHYMFPDFLDSNSAAVPRERGLRDAINEVLTGLGIETPLSIEEFEKIGFRLMFGNATLSHVGRGLTYLLPIVQLGLFSDPNRFKHSGTSPIFEDNVSVRLCAFEEPESHLHPKVQARLATWFVALAQANRQVIVETHSDHLIRKLRLTIADAISESDFERWLSENVRIIYVAQNDGKTIVESSPLRKDGGLDIWPEDFMDAATTGEQQIYMASLAKDGPPEDVSTLTEVLHLDGDEPDVGA
ncbi:AAA family ATPase [Alicycliphilus sp. T452]